MNGPATVEMLRFGMLIARCPHRYTVWTGTAVGPALACAQCGTVALWERP